MKTRTTLAALALALFASMAAGTAHAQSYFQVWPYLPDGGGWETFIRHTTGTNPSTLSLILVNERGAPSRYELRVDAGEVRHVNSSTLRRAGVTAGPWWAWATWTGSAPPPRPFLRTSDGFVVPLGLVMEGIPSSLVRNVANTDSRLRGMQWGIRGLTLNPGRNTNQVGVVQIANLSPTQDSRIAFVLSDDGEGFAIGTSNLPAGNARRFQSTEIERIAGAQPQGKWRVSVLSTQLLEGQTAIWSRPTALYAPTGDQTPETVPITGGSAAHAQAADGGTDAPTGVAEAWDRMAQGLAAHLAQDAARQASPPPRARRSHRSASSTIQRGLSGGALDPAGGNRRVQDHVLEGSTGFDVNGAGAWSLRITSTEPDIDVAAFSRFGDAANGFSSLPVIRE